MGHKKTSNQLRIIGGEWRSRRIKFADAQGLRPTLDRVRETLFNWIQWDIEGAKVLDTFAGSGALGYEALSRGAKEVVFIEKDGKAAVAIKQALEELDAKNAQVWGGDALEYLKQTDGQFDLIFLDPPFNQNLLPQACELLDGKLLSGTKIYLEVEASNPLSFIPESWQTLKRKDGKEFSFMLFEKN